MVKSRMYFYNTLINKLVDDSCYEECSNIIETFDEYADFVRYMTFNTNIVDKTFCILAEYHINVYAYFDEYIDIYAYFEQHVLTSYYIPIEMDEIYLVDEELYMHDVERHSYTLYHDETLESILSISNTLPSSDENLNIHDYHIFNSDITVINNQLYKRFMPSKIPSELLFDSMIFDKHKIYVEYICSFLQTKKSGIKYDSSFENKKINKFWNYHDNYYKIEIETYH